MNNLNQEVLRGESTEVTKEEADYALHIATGVREIVREALIQEGVKLSRRGKIMSAKIDQIRLKTGDFLILETKGQDTQRDKTKRGFLNEWVKAVNEHSGFGRWKWAVSKDPGDVGEILARAVSGEKSQI